jgi:hypothetical protein
MSLPPCPVCSSPCEFLGNEAGTGKSWYACRVHVPNHVFSRKLIEPPRFGFQGRD